MAPKDVNKANEADVWAYMYVKKSRHKKPSQLKKTKFKPSIKFNVGQFVRVSFQKRPLVKSYMDQFSTEVFKIISVRLKENIPMYKLQDLQGQSISGYFYNFELLAVDKDEQNLWFIEKILKKKKADGKAAVLCKMGGVS